MRMLRETAEAAYHVPNHLPVLHFLFSLPPHHILDDAPLLLRESAQVRQSCRSRAGSACCSCRWRRRAPHRCASRTRRREHLTARAARSFGKAPIARRRPSHRAGRGDRRKSRLCRTGGGRFGRKARVDEARGRKGARAG